MNHALAPGFHHYPFFPWQFGMPFSSNPPIPGGLGHHVSLCDPGWRRVKEGPIGEKQTEPSLPEGARTRQPPIPDQLGPNRSFYDGQWMMPPGGHFYPYDNGIEGYSMDHPFRPAPVFAPSSNPPVSSIRLSEITRRHLDILRSRLKYLEDQLSYNRHQIDERAVEGDARTVREYITQFEGNLQAQLSIEGGHHPKPDSRSAHDAPTSTKTDGTSKSSNAADHQSAMSAPFRAKQGSQGHYSMGYKTADDKPRSRSKTGINSTKSVSAFAGWKPPGNAIVGSGQLTEKPTLPTNAAMAAPFRPNSRASNFQGYMQENSSSRGGSYMDRDAEGQPLGRTMMPGFSNTTIPYLVGYLPFGVRPDLAKHSDFMYGRPLTEDEQRARHMYWGKAPGHLQKGLPKFDGKDFFPPSPTKDRFTDDSIPSVHEMPPGSTTPARIVPMTKDPSDPFQELSLCESSGQILARNGPGNSTQSECIPRPEQESSGGLTVTTNRSMPQGRRLGRSLDELNRASEDTEPTSSGSVKEKSSSDEADEDDRELIFTGRQTITKIGKTHNDIWTSMLKKEPGSANAVFGTVSPTTVQGVLPQYASYATASLTPTIAIANKPISPRSVASKKCDQGDTKARSRTRAWMRSENCPPTEMGF
ncbi:hypothetical protein GMORB2_1101 [Geosmithia morbida]|uniref:Uncharacterized protein n=1 Tax=Geosmithia morbida TaxID=1094350 RepID=A0A9P5D7J7_9HYPO|nr:uncharacterized protein GMORB2_1101 [Geosmithia morbida]KAF4125855.1 hypothetical protein GMORB2_1101 [Geosmithia morbida]